MKTLVLTLSVFACHLSANCDENQQDKKAQLRCLEQQLQQTQRELSTWENNLQFKLEQHVKTTGRQDALNGFNKSRQSFQSYQEQDCRWQFQLRLPESQAAAIAYKSCQLRHIQQRIDQLKLSDFQPENN
ncbi:lysozyme inhibitor LprI family protein [Rheinheimera sp.]|uniref:lysozyme inhibitor LprI family protein n=1 Tax=Rheinheimera sp. TaxID=1869214 RepID=UPI00307E4D2D